MLLRINPYINAPIGIPPLVKARPAERGFTSDEIIRPHIEYNGWFRRNKSKFQLFIDNTEKAEEETA